MINNKQMEVLNDNNRLLWDGINRYVIYQDKKGNTTIKKESK
jgi:hypothetical protein